MEVQYLFRMKREFGEYRPSEERLISLAPKTNDRDFCYEGLKKVSRSFAVVIQQLPKELQDPVCIFYLILRGLDTVEDDMDMDPTRKFELLEAFAHKINGDPFNVHGVGDTQDYRDLMEHFDKIVRVYQGLAPQYREIITDITDKMAFGMKKYAEKSVLSYEDWDDYCYYVAGLVGIGLSKLFYASDLESDPRLKDETLSNEMGLFLQKTNIIRDFAEDLEQQRVFWPEEAWKKRVKDLKDLQQEESKGLEVLNEMIINALQHVPACLEYLGSLSNTQVFRFCAIPQLMAIATLKELYNNVDVLHRNVKIRKGKTAKYFMSVNTFEQTEREFKSILQSITKHDTTNQVATILAKLK